MHLSYDPVMVECDGFEPSLQVCRTCVLPLTRAPLAWPVLESNQPLWFFRPALIRLS
jgi:hypothetical protein